MSTTALLSLFNGVGTKKVKKMMQKRGEIQITKGDLHLFNSFITARELTKHFMEIQSIASHSLYKALYNKFISAAWETRRRPKNPRIHTTKNGKVDNTAIFQVKSQFNGLNAFSLEENPQKAIIDALVGSGGVACLPKDIAENFVYNEISCEPNIVVRPITELSVGRVEENEFIPSTQDEKAAASKLILMLTANPNQDGWIKVKGLTDEERDLIIQKETVIKVKDPDGLWQRIFKYAKNIYQFKRILEILKPVMLFSHAKFAIADTLPEKNARLAKYAQGVLSK